MLPPWISQYGDNSLTTYTTTTSLPSKDPYHTGHNPSPQLTERHGTGFWTIPTTSCMKESTTNMHYIAREADEADIIYMTAL